MSDSKQCTGSTEAARALKALGIERIFGVCGDHVNALYRDCSVAGIEIVGARHEAAAVQMADGYARASGRPGVAIVTGGPGHTNAITGLAVAHSARSPVLVLSGLTPVDQRERGGQQALHQADMVRSVTKFSMEIVRADHVAEYVTRAVQLALAGPRGPVSLSLPVDVLNAVLAGEPRYRVPDALSLGGGELRIEGHCIDVAADQLRHAQRPVLVIGSGAWPGLSQPQACECVSALGVPAFTLDRARGLVPDDGRIGFGYADPVFNPTFRMLKEADLLLLAGAPIDFHLCFGGPQLLSPQCRVVQFHDEAFAVGMGRAADVAVHACPGALLRSLSQSVSREKAPRAAQQAWLERVQQQYKMQQENWRREIAAFADADGIHPAQLCASLARHHTANTAVIIDGGDFVHWPRNYFGAQRPGHWMDAVLMGNLGTALPLGLGAQYAFPDDPVWVFVGDGGFGFYSWELATAVEQRKPIKVILGNDAAWGIEKRLQLNEFGAHVGCDLPYTRYDRFAELVGAKGFHVSAPGELDAVVDAFIAESGPCLLNVDIRKLAGRPFADFSRGT